MTFYIKQKFFSFRDKFFVYDSNGEGKYYVEGEVFSLGKKLHLYKNNGNRLADIDQKFFSFLPRFAVTTAEGGCFEIVKNFTFFSPRYSVNPFGWTVFGNFFIHEYEVFDGERSIVRVSKDWFSLGDAYKIEVRDEIDEVAALSIVLVIDACIDQQSNT